MRRFGVSGPGAEAALIGLLFAASAWWGGRYVTAYVESGRQPSFYQHYFEPAVMLACGRGFTVADAPRPQLVDDFLFRRIDSLDCDELPPQLAAGTRDVYQYAWIYLMGTVGVAWKILGVSWSGLTPLFGVLFGLVTVLAYSIFRVGVPRLPAALAAAMIAVSPLHLQNLPHLRDYAKAPFVLALVLLLLWLVRWPLPARALLAVAAAYGVVLGFGYGFRTDLLANIPPFLVTLLFFLPGGIVRGFGVRVAAAVLMVATFALVSWPATTYVVSRGGCQWHAVLLGLSDAFSRDLGVAPAFYDWVPTFSDEYLHTAIDSYDARLGGTEPIAYCSAAYDAASGAQLRAIVSRFPADAVTRAYASILRVIDLPFFLWRDGWDSTRGSMRGAVLHAVAGASRLAVVLVVLLLGTRSLRLGLFALLAVMYFGGYPSMQFSDRHFFHLEFLGWAAMAWIGWHGVQVLVPDGRARLRAAVADWWRVLPVAARFAALAAAVILGPLWGLRAYQHRQAESLTADLLAAPRVAVPVVAAADGRSILVSPGALDDLDTQARQVAYLDVHVDLAACPQGVSLDQRYDPARGPYDFSGPLHVRSEGVIPSRILAPVYRGFQGFTLTDATASCIQRVERLQSVQGRPLLPVLALSENWRTQPLHQRLRAPGWWRRLFQ